MKIKTFHWIRVEPKLCYFSKVPTNFSAFTVSHICGPNRIITLLTNTLCKGVEVLQNINPQSNTRSGPLRELLRKKQNSWLFTSTFFLYNASKSASKR